MKRTKLLWVCPSATPVTPAAPAHLLQSAGLPAAGRGAVPPPHPPSCSASGRARPPRIGLTPSPVPPAHWGSPHPCPPCALGLTPALSPLVHIGAHPRPRPAHTPPHAPARHRQGPSAIAQPVPVRAFTAVSAFSCSVNSFFYLLLFPPLLFPSCSFDGVLSCVARCRWRARFIYPVPILRRSKEPKKQAGTHGALGTELVVTYFFCGEEIPYRRMMKTHSLTLGHFKEQLRKKGNYR